jgi:hypothetical protein
MPTPTFLFFPSRQSCFKDLALFSVSNFFPVLSWTFSSQASVLTMQLKCHQWPCHYIHFFGCFRYPELLSFSPNPISKSCQNTSMNTIFQVQSHYPLICGLLCEPTAALLTTTVLVLSVSPNTVSLKRHCTLKFFFLIPPRTNAQWRQRFFFSLIYCCCLSI